KRRHFSRTTGTELHTTVVGTICRRLNLPTPAACATSPSAWRRRIRRPPLPPPLRVSAPLGGEAGGCRGRAVPASLARPRQLAARRDVEATTCRSPVRSLPAAWVARPDPAGA